MTGLDALRIEARKRDVSSAYASACIQGSKTHYVPDFMLYKGAEFTKEVAVGEMHIVGTLEP